MRWRLTRLDWSYAAGELIIVTAGVLIALAIDQWNDDRLNRAEEILIVGGLLSDLEFDQRGIELGQSLIPEKEASLQRVYRYLTSVDEVPTDPRSFLGDVIKGSQYGWVQFVDRRTTYDELLGSGRLSLIRDRGIRIRIAEYYAFFANSRNRISERRTDYPDASYGVVPRIDEFELDPRLASEELEDLALRAKRTLTQDIVIAEINFSRFVSLQLVATKEIHEDLSGALQAYRDAIR